MSDEIIQMDPGAVCNVASRIGGYALAVSEQSLDGIDGCCSEVVSSAFAEFEAWLEYAWIEIAYELQQADANAQGAAEEFRATDTRLAGSL